MHIAFCEFNDGATGGIWYPTGWLPGRNNFTTLVQDEADTVGRPSDLGADGALVQAAAAGSVPKTTVYAGTDGKGALADTLFGPAFRLSMFERFPDGDPALSGASNKFGTAPFDAPQDNRTDTVLWEIIVPNTATGTLSIVDYEDPTIDILGAFDLAATDVAKSYDLGGIPLNRGWGVTLDGTLTGALVGVLFTIPNGMKR